MGPTMLRKQAAELYKNQSRDKRETIKWIYTVKEYLKAATIMQIELK